MRYIFFATLLCRLHPFASAVESWPQFHGPDMIAHTDVVDLPLRWSESENVKWKTPLPGRAWSSPVVWGRQIWVTNATEDGKKMSALCIDLDSGKVLHDIVLFRPPKLFPLNQVNSFASPTPAIGEGRVFAHFGTYGTACVDTATAEVLWKREDLRCDHEVGPGSSVVLHEGRLILTYDGMDKQFIAALDPATGKTIWRTDRSTDFGSLAGMFRKAFNTPAISRVNGATQVVVPGASEAIAFDFENGKEIWKVRYGKALILRSKTHLYRVEK